MPGYIIPIAADRIMDFRFQTILESISDTGRFEHSTFHQSTTSHPALGIQTRTMDYFPPRIGRDPLSTAPNNDSMAARIAA